MRRETVQLVPAYLLHQRPWRDSSKLIEAFSRSHGRIGLVARGVRSARSKIRANLAPFTPLLLSWTRRGELGTLTGAERAGECRELAGSVVMPGYYLNELLMRLLQRDDPHEEVFDLYSGTLAAIVDERMAAAALRRFERRLLEELGYGLDLTTDQSCAQPIDPNGLYRFDMQTGARRVQGTGEPAAQTLPGATLLAMARDDYSDSVVEKRARHLFALALGVHLGPRPLRVRDVARALYATRAGRAPEQAE